MGQTVSTAQHRTHRVQQEDGSNFEEQLAACCERGDTR